MARHDIPIGEYPLRKGVNPGITFAPSFQEWESAHAAGLDLYEWNYGVRYGSEFKAKVIAWWELHGQVELHTKDAVLAAEESIAKRGGG